MKMIKALFEVILKSFLLLCGGLLLLCGGEMWFRPLLPDTQKMFAVIAVAGGIVIFATQAFLFLFMRKTEKYKRLVSMLRRENGDYKVQINSLEKRRKNLNKRVEELTAHRNIDCAAASSENLDDFMDSIARLARDNNGASELTFFLDEAGVLQPKAYYRLDGLGEFCLTFSPSGATAIANDLHCTGEIVPAVFRVKGMSVTGLGRHTTVEGELLYNGTPVGSMRLGLYASTEKKPDRETLRRVVSSELSRVCLDASGVREAFASGSPVAAPRKNGLAGIASAVCADGEKLGVIRMGFPAKNRYNLYDQQMILASAGRHIARAVRNERIYQQAIRDGLTGLYNKRHFLQTIEQQFSISQRHNGKLALMLLDIDHFKKVNDTWGHLTGDIILKEVSALLQETVRSCDMPCRYGGEELLALLPEAGIDGAYTLAERLRKKIEGKNYCSDKGESLRVTASLGVAELTCSMERPEDLVAAADEALYAAKHSGRNQVRCASSAASNSA